MGKKQAPAPQVVYTPPPPPPSAPEEVETQSLRSQLALNELAGEQNRLNMETGAQLDRTNSEFFTNQDIRKVQTAGAEERLSTGKTGEEQRATIGKSAQEQRNTDLQSEMFRRYKENRDFEQAQNQYRT
jgi:hypothetical protein